MELAKLDFDVLAPGHGVVGTKEHVFEYIEYIDDLINAVKQRMDQGESLEQIQESLQLSEYSDWIFYEQFLKMNIEAVHKEFSGGQ